MPRARRVVYKADGTLKDPAICEFCGVRVARPCDLQRHTQRHLRGEERALRSFSCPFINCGFKSLQKSNMDTHIRSVHTRIKDQECPDCEFATADPGSLTRHRKRRHEYVPEHRKPRMEQPMRITPGEFIIVNSGNRYSGHNPGWDPSSILQTTKASNSSNLRLDTLNTTNALCSSFQERIPLKGSTPRPPSIAGLLNAEPSKIRPSNLAALLNPLPELPLDKTLCRVEQSPTVTKSNQRPVQLYGFSRCTSL